MQALGAASLQRVLMFGSTALTSSYRPEAAIAIVRLSAMHLFDSVGDAADRGLFHDRRLVLTCDEQAPPPVETLHLLKQSNCDEDRLEKDEFLNDVKKRSALDLATFYFGREEVAAFSSAASYKDFISLVQEEVGNQPQVVVVGTGNWKYSLNPYKSFKRFDEKSDIDVAVVSAESFHETWEEIRSIHRRTWWDINHSARASLLRNGENVYSGFVSPAWIPGGANSYRFRYLQMLNRLSNQSPGRREVKILFFKNITEALDYYRRGFQIAKRSIT